MWVFEPLRFRKQVNEQPTEDIEQETAIATKTGNSDFLEWTMKKKNCFNEGWPGQDKLQ